MFQPITKYATQILEPEIVPEIVRKAFKVAQTEKPGAAFIDFPENIAEMTVDKQPIKVQTAYTSEAPDAKIEEAAQAHLATRSARSSWPATASSARAPPMRWSRFAEVLRIPVANTFMAKGVMPFTNELSLGTIGLKARDLPWFAFEKADVVICVGYDMVEYHPDMWNPDGDKTIIHIDALPAEVDEHYIVAVGVLGDIGTSLRGIALKAKPQTSSAVQGGAQGDRRGPRRVLRTTPASRSSRRRSSGTCAKCSGPDDIAISDVGAHKMWMSRMYRAERPEHLHHLQRLRRDGHRRAGRASPPSWPIRTARSSRSPATPAS